MDTEDVKSLQVYLDALCQAEEHLGRLERRNREDAEDLMRCRSSVKYTLKRMYDMLEWFRAEQDRQDAAEEITVHPKTPVIQGNDNGKSI